MKIAIMQPYFFPYLGYYSLIQSTDKWIVFDTPQYIKKAWVNRNRVLKINGGTKYIGIAIKSAPRDTPINQIEISDLQWRKNILNQLDYYKKVKAPRYDEVFCMLEKAFDIDSNNLSEVLINCLKVSCQFLDINFNYDVFSKMSIDTSNVKLPGDWAYEISKSIGAKTYVNPYGGIDIFNINKFYDAGLEIKFLRHNLPEYDQKNGNFEAALSILDVMMFNDNDKIRQMLLDYKFI